MMSASPDYRCMSSLLLLLLHMAGLTTVMSSLPL